jgi:hypothetical protein
VEKTTARAKARLIQNDLCGPEGLLFHGCANIETFSANYKALFEK